MNKMLIIDHSKCTGCRLCEVVCSIKKNGASNPARARITVIKWESICVETPMLCQQCETAPCIAVCPVGALARDEELARVAINYDLCIGCKFCVAACPFGAMGIDTVARQVIKCDLCDGDPTCVKFCETKALQYVDATTVNTVKMREAAEKLSELLKKTVARPGVS
ncbi:MAG: 4Fe-4S dicluster domain-containing protein [Dehalococcoidia bacterium]|nr:4Fe-4S dicluster domain-containing protein [Dehalococcoidia bacterium]